VTLDEQVSFYAQHTEADPTRRSYSIGDQAASEVVRLTRAAGRVAVDIETAGLGDLAFKVKVIIIATSQRSCVLDATDPKHRAAARDAIGAARELVFHNSCFDVPPLVTAGIMRIEDIAKVYDTIIYSRMAFTGEMDRHSLGELEKKFLAKSLRTLSKDNLAEWAKANRMTKGKVFEVARYEDPVYAMYAGWDGILTSMVLEPVRAAARQQLTDHPFGRYGADAVQAEYLMEREQRVNRIMLRRSARGIRLDDERVAHEQERLRVEMNELAEQLVEFGIEEASNRNQLATALDAAGVFGEDYPRTEKTGRPSTQAKHLEMIDHPAVIAFKAHDDRRRLFTYLENARLVAARTDGRIHPQVNIHKARTGRASYDNPALQQFTPSARQILLADEDDRMVSIDWASIEPVTAANLAGDTMLIERFEAGEKIYDVISSEVSPYMPGVPYKHLYKKVKVVVLAKMYAQGIKSLAAGLKTSLEEAQELQHRVSLSMPRTDRFVRWAAAWSEEFGKTWTMSGRIVNVDPEYGYKGSNFVVQGSAYDVLSETVVATEDAGLADGIYLTAHDEMVVSEEVAHDVRKIMETPPERLIELSGRVPKLRTDAVLLGDRWNDADDCPPWPLGDSAQEGT
jgi:DNA polymerase-1